MKIGITCHSTYGGSGVLASELGRFLARHGHEVHFVTAKVPFRLLREYQEGIFFHEVDAQPYPLFEQAPYDLALASKMKEVFVAENLDLLHVHYAIPHAVCALLAREMVAPRPMPIVTTLHGTDITIVGQEKSYFDVTRLGINRSTAVTAVSDYLRQETERFFAPTLPVRRIYNFVDLELFRRTSGKCRKNHFARNDQVLYLHISNFRPVKRIPDVIRIFARVREAVDAVLLLVGEGPMLREARDLVAALGLQKQVKFLGKQEDVVAILSCADVLLFPSETESFGLAPLEAMACEIPVVSTFAGGIPEVVLQGETGYLSAVGDVEEMAKNAVRLGESKALRAEMGKKGRKVAEERFGPGTIVPQYEALYAEAMKL